MELYLKLFEVLFPVFFVVGIGYYLGKNNPKIDTTFITNFAANIGTPAMIIYALTSTGISFEIFKNSIESKKIAENGKKKYMKYFSSNLVADFIVTKTLLKNSKNKFIWHK